METQKAVENKFKNEFKNDKKERSFKVSMN